MGTYVLALWLAAEQSLSVGYLGRHHFPAGWYLYVGSARGPGGLRARLERHRRRLGFNKRVHWHVDLLREHSTWGGAWIRPSEERLECTWARTLARLPGARVVVPGFGASDCHCAAHLLYVLTLPGDDWFAQALGAERTEVRHRTIDELMAALLEGSDESREEAAVALGRLGTEAIPPLAELLTSHDADARWWAARALAEVGGEGAVPLLVGILGDTDPDVRACACLALGRVGGDQAAHALAAGLADRSPFVASIAADGLSMIGEPAVGVLAECLAAEETHTRLLAVRALGRIKSKAVIGPLFGVLDDSSYLVRHYAREALEALGVGMVFFSP
jgi:Uri superfamily endonuclease